MPHHPSDKNGSHVGWPLDLALWTGHLLRPQSPYLGSCWLVGSWFPAINRPGLSMFHHVSPPSSCIPRVFCSDHGICVTHWLLLFYLQLWLRFTWSWRGGTPLPTIIRSLSGVHLRLGTGLFSLYKHARMHHMTLHLELFSHYVGLLHTTYIHSLSRCVVLRW